MLILTECEFNSFIEWLEKKGKITDKDFDDFNQEQASTFPAMVGSVSPTNTFYETPEICYQKLVNLLTSFNRVLGPMPEIDTQQGGQSIHFENIPGKLGGNAPLEGYIHFGWYRMTSGNWEITCYCC